MYKQHGFGAVSVLAALLVLGVVAGMGWYVINQDDENSNTPINSQTSEKDESSDNEKTLEVENRGTYRLQEPTSTVRFNNITYIDNSIDNVVENPAEYITFEKPLEWPLYKQDGKPSAYDGGDIFVRSPQDHYLHVFYVDAIGGECISNEQTYTLYKKLKTRTPHLYFVEYRTDINVKGSLNLATLDPENVPAEMDIDSESYKYYQHVLLEEGQSHTNTCNFGRYSPTNIGTIFATLSSSPKNELTSNLSWDDIQDDEEFIDMLQSLTVQKE